MTIDRQFFNGILYDASSAEMAFGIKITKNLDVEQLQKAIMVLQMKVLDSLDRRLYTPEGPELVRITQEVIKLTKAVLELLTEGAQE